jgi:hypothetical protein
MITTKATLQKLLKQHIVKINFTKADGSDRTMICSLKKDLLPENKNEEATPKQTKKENPNTLAVWDIEKDAFRSFRLDALKSYDVIEEGYEQ